MAQKYISIECLILGTKKSFQCPEIVPKGDKRKAKKEAEYPSKLCHQWGAWVDQLLSLDLGLVGDGPEGKYWMLRFEGWRIRFSQETVFLVFARFPAPGYLKDFLHLWDLQLGEHWFIFPAKYSRLYLLHSPELVGQSATNSVRITPEVPLGLAPNL